MALGIPAGIPALKSHPRSGIPRKTIYGNSAIIPVQERGSIAEVKLIPAICPRCGASLKLPDNAQHLYCMYCGTQIFVGRADVARRIECNVCDGYGRVDICRACNGTGRCSWATRGSSTRNDIFTLGFTSYCDGGTCSACGGTGRYFLLGCPGCNGTGQCPRCLGTGKCPACRGVGSIPNPKGYERCRTCHGTGLIDPGEPKSREVPLVDRCSECGKELHDENPFCPYCGHTRRKCPQCDAVWKVGATWCPKCGFGKPQARDERPNSP
jgi:DNA-directed RNA polymerase subunit RPC12/RpoP